MNIEKAFSRIEINVYDLDRTTRYKCVCGELIEFKYHDFEKHWKKDFTNLREADFVGAPEGLSFLDFYCPACNRPTTVQYSLSAGGQHGECWFTIEELMVGNYA